MDTNIDYRTRDLDLSNQANANSFITNYNKISGSNLNTDSNALIKASNLANVQDIKLPPPVVNNTNTDSLTNIGLTSTEQADVDLKQSEKDLANTNKPESVKDGYIAKFLGLNTTLAGKADETAKLQEEQQLAEKTKAANEINNRILTTSRAYEKQIRERQKNLSGTFGGATTQDIKNIERARDEQLADLSIQKAVALGDIETANKIVETAINAKYDPIQTQLDNYEKLISFAQNDMTESEIFAAQSKLDSAKEQTTYIKTLQQNLINDLSASGQSSLASQAMNIQPDDPQAREKLSYLQSKLAPKGGDMLITDVQAFDREMKIATDFEKYAKDARSAQQYVKLADIAYNDIIKDLKEGKSINAQSQALIVSFNRLIDPSSVVRESEYARTPEGSSLLNKLDGYKTKILQGGAGVSKEDLELMRDTAKSLYKGYESTIVDYATRTTKQAEQLSKMTAGRYGNLDRILTPDVQDAFSNRQKTNYTNISSDEDSEIDNIMGGSSSQFQSTFSPVNYFTK